LRSVPSGPAWIRLFSGTSPTPCRCGDARIHRLT